MNGFDDVGSPPRHLGGTLEDNFEPTWSGGLLDCSMFDVRMITQSKRSPCQNPLFIDLGGFRDFCMSLLAVCVH
jgi:hypothetical protein